MKYLSLLLASLFSIIASAQTENSLLWEISKGNNSKKSYIYGTMHVNDKVSYHLSDDFFEALTGVEVVANESDPQTWTELYEMFYKNFSNDYQKLYAKFYLKPIAKTDLNDLFNTDNTYFNNMLSGNNSLNSDYQEDTVLDMFIFQVGKKLGKRIVGLEDVIDSYIPIFKINEEEAKPKEENKVILYKLLKNKSFNEALNDLYREKNIQLLDSIYKLTISEKAHDAIIVSRNKDMANSMDKVMKNKQTIFAAVGAAHLAGKDGMLEILKRKGYTVKPINTALTDKGKELKKSLENNFPKPTLKVSQTKDGIISFPVNEMSFEDRNIIVSPDFASGAALKINRKPIHNFLKKHNLFTEKTLDSLLFENIPGTTLKKELIEKDNYKLLSVSNITKTNNNQHYNFYITPLEVISISLVGPKNYVDLYENLFFNSIKLKELSTNWSSYAPSNGKFTVELPEYHVVHSNDDYRNVEIEAYDVSDKSYYFILENTESDVSYLEETNFELQQIQKEFLLQYNVTPNFIKNGVEVESQSTLENGNTIYLKTKVIGPKYYLLGCVNASTDKKERFFNSFLAQKFNYSEELRLYTNKDVNFSILIPFESNKALFYDLEKNEVDTKNIFTEKTKTYTFKSESGTDVHLGFFQYNKYEFRENIDSIRSNIRRYFLNSFNPIEELAENNYDYDYSLNSILGGLKSKKGFHPSKWYEELYNYKENKSLYYIIDENYKNDEQTKRTTLNFLVGRKNSDQAIKAKLLLKEDEYVMLTSLVDKSNPNSDQMVDEVFASIQLNAPQQFSIFSDKWNVFLEDANSESDTIRYSAMNSLRNLSIKEQYVTKVIKFLNDFEFKPSESSAQEQLLELLVSKNDVRIEKFLEDYYKRESSTNETKINILKSLATLKTKSSYEKILELMEFDLPISNNEYEITSLFYKFEQDVENSKVLLPKIFQFYSIPEYNEPILEFSAAVVDEYPKAAKKLKPFQKMIFTNAKLQYKRLKSWKEKQNAKEDDDEDDYDSYDYNDPSGEMIPYLTLLYNNSDQSKVSEFYGNLNKIDIPEINIELMRLESVNNKLSETDKAKYLANPKLAFLFMLLENKTFHKSNDEVAALALENFYEKKKNDSIVFLEKKVEEYNNKKAMYYFYKITEKEPKLYENYLISLAFVMNDDKLNINAFEYLGKESIKDDSKLQEIYERIINESLFEDRPRTNFRKTIENSGSEFLDTFSDY
ncbi:TraB/GumN family protein [Flavobacterium haoranii]|uniref:Uncharacterized conserved protein YbaP, TraB family n=1 Tax=Flavobacterium haoranii TaxID=683124 RepID=A0A1M6FH33_9FLAO|nr:TraB/GumN family protein [Flavobacterium haoranii]SHI96902.1 Uncharacterized conserved protein YbaP, TraB family [Flavobacterium haoranii]